MASYPYQQTADSGSRLGFYPRYDDPASPRPSAQMSLYDDQKGFLQPIAGGSPYPPQPYGQQRSYFDDDNAPARFAGQTKQGRGNTPFFKRKKWLIPIVVMLVLAAAAGVVAVLMLTHRSSSENSKVSQNNNESNSHGSTRSGAQPTGTSSAVTPTATVTPLPRYNWLDPNNVAYGVNVGNWLVIERWLDEDWFTSLCPDCVDEWNLAAHLGPNAIPTLQAHYNSFIKESDIDTIKSMGMNMIRVTLGYWAVIDTPGEPFVNAGQLDQLRKLMEWCHARQIYITISMHGLPGSQSGDQSTGRVKSWDVGGAAWFTAQNQARSDQVIQVLATWITQQQPYSSVIASVLPVNEPKQTVSDADSQEVTARQDIVQAFYVRSYKTLSNIGMVMMIHPGYLDGQNPKPWGPFISQNNMDPNLIVWETHPYPGYFPLKYDPDVILETVCNYAQLHQDIQVPVFFGEFSTLSGIKSSAFLQQYWNTQVAAYSQSAGSTFWNWKAMNSTNPDKALNSQNMTRYDFQFLMNQGIVQKPAAGQSTKQFVTSLSNNACTNQRKKRALHDRNGGRLARLF
ncbi:hypothetical protein OC846_003595 [Tilletia horrida]|uniref:glucan 1,3-beta-glucosidase n=1 Tax=Tilletia horrida TaxID=155126 RepID=A0AAN6GPR7_9BASI|nr:hypothetical protein OC846_003595 [Tilletia horrida]KAK0550894.1 hypothetical protein OC845_002457 [Tilletia horrida]KAK0565730.1 hypothetical protein OC861_003600 [Tilletia horrida]